MKASLGYVQVFCPQCEKEGFSGFIMNWHFDYVYCTRIKCALFQKKFTLPKIKLKPFGGK